MLEYSPRKLDGIGFGDRRDIKEEKYLVLLYYQYQAELMTLTPVTGVRIK